MPGIRIEKLTLEKCLPYVLVLAGVVGFLASFVLTYDKIQILQNTNYDPSCNINPIFSCGSVMKTEQASLLGVPNTIFGLVGYSMLITFGVLLAGGAKVKRWVWLGAQVAASIGVVFMHYLFFQGVFRINAICPWCFTVWMVTIPIFWYITLFNLGEKNIAVPQSMQKVALLARKYHGEVLVTWYMVIFAILLQHFWYYWSTVI